MQEVFTPHVAMWNLSKVLQTVLLTGLVILSAANQPAMLGVTTRKKGQDINRLFREFLSKAAAPGASVTQANWHSPTVNANQPPTFTRVTPSPVSATAGVPVTFTAKADDAECDLAGSEWYLGDGTFLGYTWYSGCSFTTSKAIVFNATGPYRIIANSFDTHTAYSNQVTWNVTVLTNQPPTISLVSPSTPLSLALHSSQTFTVQASDVDCDLRGSAWYLNGTHLGNTYDYSAPYCSGTTSKTIIFNATGYELVEVRAFDCQPSTSGCSSTLYSPAIAWAVMVNNPNNYSVTFFELGLPSGTNWCVTIGNLPSSCTNGSSETVEGLSGVLNYAYQGPVTGSDGAGYYCTSSCSGSISPDFTSVSTNYVHTPDFSISANPNILTAVPGSSREFIVRLESVNGFTGTVILSVTVSPAGPIVSCDPSSVVLSSGGTGSSTCTFSVPSTSTIGSYKVIVTGAGGSTSHSTEATVTVLSCFSSEGNFKITTFSVSELLNVGPSGVKLSVKVTLIMPKEGTDLVAFGSDIAGCFGFAFDPRMAQGALVIISIGGLQTLVQALETAWNDSLGTLLGSIDLLPTIQFLFDDQGYFNFFGFIELFDPKLSECTLSLTAKLCPLLKLASGIGQELYDVVVKGDPADAVKALSIILTTAVSKVNFGAGWLVPEGQVYKVGWSFDLNDIAYLVSTAEKLAERPKKMVQLVIHLTKAAGTAATLIGGAYYFFAAVVTGFDIVMDRIDPGKPFTEALDWVTTIVDPDGTTIDPSLTSDGKTLLGYDGNGSFVWNATGVGFVVSGPDGYVFVLANSTTVHSSVFLLSHVGNRTILVPYTSDLSEGFGSVPAVAAGSLSNNEMVQTRVAFSSVDGTKIASWTNKVKIDAVRYTVTSESIVIKGNTTIAGMATNATVLALVNSLPVANVTATNGSFDITLVGLPSSFRLLLLASFPGGFGDGYAINVLKGGFTFTEPVVGIPISFEGSASGGIPGYSFSWNFGDGTKGAGSTVSHVYPVRGSYEVTLTITDNGGGTWITTQSVTVGPQTPPLPSNPPWWEVYWYAIAITVVGGVLSTIVAWKRRRKEGKRRSLL